MKSYVAPFYTKAQLEELDENQIHFPYSDDDATYVGKDHQYELTSKYFQERGRNLDLEVDGTQPDKDALFLTAVRRKFYSYIYTHNKSSRNQINYMIAKRGLTCYPIAEYRAAFLEAMFYQGCYLLDNGDLNEVTGVDLDTMQNMSIDVIRNQERDMSKEAIGLLKPLGLNFYGRYCFIPQGKDW